MIPRDYITEWRAQAPWVQDFQVEQDLVISRALIEIFSNPGLHDALAFRGGTALCVGSRVRLRQINKDSQLVKV